MFRFFWIAPLSKFSKWALKSGLKYKHKQSSTNWMYLYLYSSTLVLVLVLKSSTLKSGLKYKHKQSSTNVLDLSTSTSTNVLDPMLVNCTCSHVHVQWNCAIPSLWPPRYCNQTFRHFWIDGLILYIKKPLWNPVTPLVNPVILLVSIIAGR